MVGMGFLNRPMSALDEAQWMKFRRYGALVFVAVYTALYLIAACLVKALFSLRHGHIAFSLPVHLGEVLFAGLMISILQAWILERRYKATIKTRELPGASLSPNL
jgi:hypothetical protein